MTHGSIVGLVKEKMVVGSLLTIWKVFVVLFTNSEIAMTGMNIVAMINQMHLGKQIDIACSVNQTVFK